MKRSFWTEKRFEALSKTCLTLFQSFVIAMAIGGILDKITGMGLRMTLSMVTPMLLIAGIALADIRIKEEAS